MSIAALCTRASACRLPTTGPPRRQIASRVVSKEERTAPGHGQAAYPEAVASGRQRQTHISRIQVRPSRRAQCAAAHPHRPDHRGQEAGVATLEAPACGPLASGEVGGQLGFLTQGLQVQVVLQQLTQQLPALCLDELLEPVVPQRRGLLAFQHGSEGVEGFPGSLKGVSSRGRVIRFHRALLPDGSDEVATFEPREESPSPARARALLRR